MTDLLMPTAGAYRLGNPRNRRGSLSGTPPQWLGGKKDRKEKKKRRGVEKHDLKARGKRKRRDEKN